jgi:hypothetical protein
MNDARRDLDHEVAIQNYAKQQERAFDLLSSSGTTNAFDIKSEPLALRERYGQDINGMSLLMARRMVEAGVPFMTVFWKEDESLHKKCKSAGGWDTHGNNFNCLRENLLPQFDRASPPSSKISPRADCSMKRSCSSPARWAACRRSGDRRSGGPGGAGAITGPPA